MFRIFVLAITPLYALRRTIVIKMKDKITLERVADSICACPYCRQSFRVTSGWFFTDNLNAPRDPSAIMTVIYVPLQLRDIFLEAGFKIDEGGYVNK